MVKKFKLSHLKNFLGLIILCHSNGTHAIEINSDLNYRLNALKNPNLSTMRRSPLWSKQMNGAISDLSISKNGKAILITTSPDSDVEGTSKSYLLSRYSSTGKLVWQLKQSSPIKEVAVSQDASFIVVSNYENQLFALNGTGKLLWSIEQMCKPIISNYNKKIICYHDDDNEPKVGFDLYDWKGAKISSFAITKDILALKLSSDEKNLVLALSGGEVVAFDSEFVPLWTKTVPGEIADVAVSSGVFPEPISGLSASTKPVVAVLYREKGPGKNIPSVARITIFKGEEVKTLSPSCSGRQIELSPDGNFVFYYGNGSYGQCIGRLSALSSKELWMLLGDKPAEFNSSINVTATQLFMGFQENAAGERLSHVLNFKYDGGLKSDFLLSSEKTAYLYNYKIASEAALLVVGTDDGKVSAYGY